MRRFVASVWLALVLAPGLALASSEKKEEVNTRGYEYLALTPAVVVNFGASGRVGFLKSEVSLRVASAAKAPTEQHMPAIRHQLIMLLSRQDEAALQSPEARETLRLAALEAVRALLVEAGGIKAEEIQDLLFTSFITQR